MRRKAAYHRKKVHGVIYPPADVQKSEKRKESEKGANPPCVTEFRSKQFSFVLDTGIGGN